MNRFRNGRFGLALLEVCSMTFSNSFDMPLRGRSRCFNGSEKFADFIQTFKKTWGGKWHFYEPFATPQECLYFDHCETNGWVKSGHLHVRKCCHLSLKRLDVDNKFTHCFVRSLVLLMFQHFALALRPYQLIGGRSRVGGIRDLSRLICIDELITSRDLTVDVSQPRFEACEAMMKHIRLALDLSHQILRRDDFEGSFHHCVDLIPAMDPERNADGSQSGGETAESPGPFPLGAEDLRVRPFLPTRDCDACDCTGSSHSSDKNFKTAELSHATSAGIDRESYSIVTDVSA